MPQPALITKITHRLVLSSVGRIHLVEQGSGPLVLLVHGFPESWYSWRHQLPVLAAAGYRAVAVDVRGYDRSSKPEGVAAYRMLELVEDNVAVVHALGEQTAVIVGHDWGATIAANSALVRPDVFRAVGLLSVPYALRGGPRPSEVFAQMGGEEEFYVSYFQEPGRAEAEIEPDVRGWLEDRIQMDKYCPNLPGAGRGKQCDEYPFRSTFQAIGVDGKLVNNGWVPSLNASLRMVSTAHNAAGGRDLGAFYARHRVFTVATPEGEYRTGPPTPSSSKSRKAPRNPPRRGHLAGCPLLPRGSHAVTDLPARPFGLDPLHRGTRS
ncbi:alpha/beta fold hydrolase [Sphaerisporangium perillae]|uniref:alpha/beta fold hydrolase n=1 Tax=Sphaerisporangium perillae TaxID=2935860 RepID=UPI00200C9FC9|nr:alpha/beta fold hydrolase [Sphaerisporangium perillae]